jgi:hypothetical protein
VVDPRLRWVGKDADMVYLVAATPQECLQSGTAHMVNEGYAIKTQSDTTVTLSRTMKPTAGLTCWILLAGLFSMGVVLLLFFLVVLLVKWRITIVATPAPDGRTRLTATGSHPEQRGLVKAWVIEAFGERATLIDAGRERGGACNAEKMLVSWSRIEVLGSPYP